MIRIIRLLEREPFGRPGRRLLSCLIPQGDAEIGKSGVLDVSEPLANLPEEHEPVNKVNDPDTILVEAEV